MGGLCCHQGSGSNGDASYKYEEDNKNSSIPFVTVNRTSATPRNGRLPTIPSTIDINTATEEDFMTLPTIGRVIAHNIVEYRYKIGAFRTVEDLVLVSGVGATRLEKIRKDIHVASDLVSSSIAGDSPVSNAVDLNLASVDELANINGIGHDTALEIVNYREKNGKYFSINDLVDPAGLLKRATLFKVKRFLIVNKHGQSFSRNASFTSSHTEDSSTGVPGSSCREVLVSKRPSIDKFVNNRDGRPIVRIATWNLQQCSLEKVNNPGVREVVCATLFENGIKILAIQELADKEALHALVSELNNPSLPNIQRIKNRSSSWECALSSTAAGKMYQGMEYNGFLYDKSANISLYSHALLEKPTDSKEFARRPLLGYFKIENIDLVVVCVHLKAVGRSHAASKDMARLTEEINNLPLVVEAIVERVANERDVLILGDFNLEPNEREFDVLRERGFAAVVPESISTNISTKNMKGSRCYDNIWISESAAALYTSKFKVVRRGLTNPWIPDGWSWGGVASDHCPVWAEFYTDNDLDPEADNKILSKLTLK